ncbi:type II toxin-antitoxin system Phd/YefM family antitoxin [Rhodococcus rhodochrous]|uniref:type II toxin-antitoxin system Phd/YefM family antitoxin n=1 Tax=Rhodococcus TaxID=1827 RepID=UPI00132ED49A|nr:MULTISPECIES: type II toxin-antitoxin system prevent-host-death family antitoxin [Rhodococcus]QHG83660.1 type II toxin-antitoxin system Phd/YefM family antitoxin [Rhodococcus rhodochrous]QOH56656.1 prevent-host-death family protein [Rhodococcus rhodochrous]WAL48695.1 type II toxin-antitoxin system prevent-host-death family antitoxin [Rhodococcus pyridinivorans]
MSVKAARKRLGELVREVNDDTVAVEIVGKRGTGVLISQDRYAALQEATFLLRSPELMDSLRREMQRVLLEAAAPTDEPRPAPARRRTKNKKKKRKKRQRSR